MSEPLFSLRDLQVRFDQTGPPVLNGLNLQAMPGEALAIVGPSGCGKSLTARALCGLLPGEAHWSGSITWKGSPLLDPGEPAWQAMRGRGAAMVLQEPATSLNPVLRVGDQIAESVRQHHGGSWTEARRKAVQLLDEVQVPEPEVRARWYPHQLSGGMRQRVLLAAALACAPELLIADEPTTALDLTVQREILLLIDRVRRERGMGLLFISHDLDVVALLCDRVAVLEGGQVVREFPVGELPVSPVDLAAPPSLDPEAPVVLTARDLQVTYAGIRGRAFSLGRPDEGVHLTLKAGEALGVAGESGSGKTTLARALTRQWELTRGEITLEGQSLTTARGADLRRLRRRVPMIFQDPGASLNPRQRVGAALREAGAGEGPGVTALLAEVGLDPDLAARFPHQLSGGQRQRVAVARCLAADPAVLVADEVTSALDAGSTRQLLDLLMGLMSRRGVALVVISHDLDVLHRVCHRVIVMSQGMVLEEYPRALSSSPCHPYTRHLLEASPAKIRANLAGLDDGRDQMGNPRPVQGPGCPWQGSCELVKPRCSEQLPPLVEGAAGHWWRCPETGMAGHSHFIDT
jgi:oligopeptide/dipeptide ABC transporter ATP-binding protein|nr:ABC transporter ATP-binding protein [Candidatus Krumholzibacteria bacterium]